MLVIPPQLAHWTAVHRIGLLLVGHGTRSSQGQAEFHNLFKQFEALFAPIVCESAFLELAEPSIDTALNRLRHRGVRFVLTVPAILFTAGHAVEDIPQAVQLGLEKNSLFGIGQTPTLECAAEVVELSTFRFRQAVCGNQCVTECCGKHCSTIYWILVGRGSSSRTATEKMREFGHLRWQQTPTKFVKVAFIHGQDPSVPDALDGAAGANCDHIVVQPHLLFSGLLIDQLSHQVQQMQQANPRKLWTLAPALGADFRLAELLAFKVVKVLERLELPIQ